MSIVVADNFQYKGGKPLDARMKFASVANMVDTPAADLYDGCFAYVTATKKYYSYDRSNETDPTLGKWVEYNSGSEVDPMPAEDMSEVIDPLPSVMSRLPILFDESGTERIVGWYKYANGTKQPVYEKCFYNITLDPIQSGESTSITPIMDATNIKLLSSDAYCYNDNGSVGEYAKMLYASMDYSLCIKLRLERDHNRIEIIHKGQQLDSYKVNATIRYTKTTDTPA